MSDEELVNVEIIEDEFKEAVETSSAADKVSRATKSIASNLMDDIDIDNADIGDLPGAIIHEEIEANILPEQDDEFTCQECFLVRHRSLISDKATKTHRICKECA
ncbi:MAG: DUF4193 domain-containing protein [Candidatus Ancillula sp.]|jgi:hypothetical protein|nr:DUF4193 domain-containing protein [Candidatus Ancillula sp.]